MAGLRRTTLGFAMIAGTLLLWVASSVATQAIFGPAEHYQKPLFISLFNCASMMCLLLPYMCCPGRGGKGPGLITSLAAVAPLSATLGMLWLTAQWIYNLSLAHTSLASNTVLSSTSTAFTFIFSLMILKDSFRWLSFGAAILSFVGCSVVAISTPRSISRSAVANTEDGDILALLSAAMFSLNSVLLTRVAPEHGVDMGHFLGMNGILALILAPVLLYIADSTGAEPFRMPNSETVVVLTMNAILGSTIASYLYASSLQLLSPLVANVCLSLSIPLSAVTDATLLKQHKFTAEWGAGATITVVGVICAAIDFGGAPDADVSLNGKGDDRGENGESSELESLLENEDDAEDSGSELLHKPSPDRGFRARAPAATSTPKSPR